MTERQRETYRSDYLNGKAGEDFVTLPSYHQSFRDAPKLSELRMAIAPGSLKYMNRNIPQWIEIPSTILQTEGDKAIARKIPEPDNDSEYMTYRQGYQTK